MYKKGTWTSNEGNIHEYYVTVYATGETKASPNVNVRNPEYQQKRKEETKAHLEDKKTKPKPPAPDYKAPVPTVRTPQKPPVAAKTRYTSRYFKHIYKR